MSLPPRATRQRIAHLVDNIPYDFAQFSLENFCAFLNQRRTKPIHLVLFPVRTKKPIGLWFSKPDRDHIMVASYEGIHPIQQVHIGLHEISHILLNHKPAALDTLTPAQVAEFAEVTAANRAAKGRLRLTKATLDCYEQEAEFMASLFFRRIRLSHRQALGAAQASSIAGIAAFVSNLSLLDLDQSPRG